MATTQDMVEISLEAGADLSSNQYHFVSIAADGQVDPTGDGLMAQGVLTNAPADAGRAASVAISGVTKVVAGGTFSAGNEIASSATGTAVVAATNDIILGTALTDGVAGQVVSILFQPRGAAA